jgi:imidazolonepropionase-like amidohydrolase
MLKRLGLVLLLGSMALAQAKPPQSGAIVLLGGKLLTITHGTIENGVLVMQDGKITAVGGAGSVSIPAGAQVIDATGMTVYPGLIDSETNLGLTEISADNMTNDMVEASDEIMPHMHTWEAFHAESALIPVTRANGVLNAIVAPQSQDTLPGQDTFVQLAGASASEMIVVKDVAMPMKFICREDCKGLCYRCGADLNEVACLCTTENVDSRLSVLLDFQKKKKMDK